MAKKIDWPPPPEQSAWDKEIGRRAGELRAEYVKNCKGGAGAGRRRWLTKAAALDLLETIGAPPAVIMLLDVLLGGVSTQLSRMDPKRPWIDQMVDYEARACNAGREVANAEITDLVILPAHPEITNRKAALTKVRKLRQAVWYPALVQNRRWDLIDNPESA